MSEQTPVDPTSLPYAYWTRQIARLGDREPVKVLAETPFALAKVIGEHSAEALRRETVPDKWTVVEIIAHLCDIDWVLGFRARTIAFDDHPSFGGMDQDLWVKRQTAREREPAELLDLFRGTRRGIVDFWRRRSSADMERVGRHDEAGFELSLGMLLKIQAGHDLVHLDQIEARV